MRIEEWIREARSILTEKKKIGCSFCVSREATDGALYLYAPLSRGGCLYTLSQEDAPRRVKLPGRTNNRE
jgi:hypothetical protein